MEESIINLICVFLGNYGKHSGEWYSFNCPECAAEKGVRYDNKFNLEVKVDLDVRGCGYYHCWRCKDINGTCGTIVSLFRKYASKAVMDEFRQIVSEYREARKYDLFSDDIPDEFILDSELSLPNEFTPIRQSDDRASAAISYLSSRGITQDIIDRYNIGYTPNSKDVEYGIRGRIIIPSYDCFDSLNYWVARDYTGKNKVRYKNPKAEKTKFIFNEGKVNWYEPVTLVEGPFDHIVVPNSIPMLGKSLDSEYMLYKYLVKYCKSTVNVFCDDDALYDAKKIYKLLNDSELEGRVRLIECPDGYDASLIFEKYGKRGILSLLSKAKKIKENSLVL